jgi:hypothetical protein
MSSKACGIHNTMARIALTAALVFALSGLVGAWCAPPDGHSDRMARKMNVLEKIFDEVLRESPHVFVSGSGASRGLLLDGYGALFTFEGSLSGGRLGNMAFGNYNLARSYFGNSGGGEYEVVAPSPPRPPKEGEEDVRVPESLEDLATDWETKREERREEARKNLAGLKIELTETLLDYGGTLGELADDQWVVVAAFLDGFGHDGDGPEQLVLKVRMRDLRQYSAGQLSLDQARGKVSIDEK